MTQPGSRDHLARYSDTSRLALFYSRAALTEHGGKSIELAHLLLGLVQADAPDIGTVLSRGLARQPLSECLIAQVSTPDILDESAEVPFANETNEVLYGALLIADQYAQQAITPGHLLLSLLRRRAGPAVECLRRAGVDTGRAEAELAALVKERGPDAV